MEEKKLSSGRGWNMNSPASSSGASTSTSGTTTRGKKRVVDLVPLVLDSSNKRKSSNSGDGAGGEEDDLTLPTALTDPFITSTTRSTTGVVSSSKPCAARVLLEAGMMQDLMEEHIKCPMCQARVVVCFPTVCIASGCRIDCSDRMCAFVRMARPQASILPFIGNNVGSPFIVRNTDYAANIAFVLAFIASGDGGKEAERLLGLLGMPNSTTMEKRSFTTIEEKISPFIMELSEEILMSNLTDAVKLYYGDDRLEKFELWLLESNT